MEQQKGFYSSKLKLSNLSKHGLSKFNLLRKLIEIENMEFNIKKIVYLHKKLFYIRFITDHKEISDLIFNLKTRLHLEAWDNKNM